MTIRTDDTLSFILELIDMKHWICLLSMLVGSLGLVAQEYPDINAFIYVDKEPKPVNLQEVRDMIGYPEEAIKNELEGTIVVRILVDETGDYVRHKIIPEKSNILATAVSEHVPMLRFLPAQRGDSMVAHWLNIPFRFRLKSPETRQLEKEAEAKTDSLTGSPEDYALWQRRAVVYSKLEQWDNAIEDFTESIDLNPRKNKPKASKSSYDELFYAYYGRAVSSFNKAASVAEGSFDSAIQDYLAAEQVMREMKFQDSAIQAMYQTILLERGYAYLLEINYPAMRQDLKALLPMGDSSARCTAYQLLAEAALNDTLPAEKVFAYEGLVSCNPEDPLLRYSLGYYRSESGQYEAAIKDFEACSAKNELLSIRIATDNRMGWCYLQLDQYDKALEAIARGKNHNVVHPQAYYYEALVYFDQGMTSKGCESLSRSINFELAGEEREAADKLYSQMCGEDE